MQWPWELQNEVSLWIVRKWGSREERPEKACLMGKEWIMPQGKGSTNNGIKAVTHSGFLQAGVMRTGHIVAHWPLGDAMSFETTRESRLKFYKMVIRNKNSFPQAKLSPTHIRFPV